MSKWDAQQGWDELHQWLEEQHEAQRHIVGGSQNYGKYLMSGDALERMEEIEAEGRKSAGATAKSPRVRNPEADRPNDGPSKAVSARYQVPCRTCGATAGQPCRALKTGRVTDTHLARINAQFDKPEQPAEQPAEAEPAQLPQNLSPQDKLHEDMLSRPVVTMTADKLAAPDRMVHGTGSYRNARVSFHYEVSRYARSKKYWLEYSGGPRHPISLSQAILLTQHPLLGQPGGLTFDQAWEKAHAPASEASVDANFENADTKDGVIRDGDTQHEVSPREELAS